MALFSRGHMMREIHRHAADISILNRDGNKDHSVRYSGHENSRISISRRRNGNVNISRRNGPEPAIILEQFTL